MGVAGPLPAPSCRRPGRGPSSSVCWPVGWEPPPPRITSAASCTATPRTQGAALTNFQATTPPVDGATCPSGTDPDTQGWDSANIAGVNDAFNVAPYTPFTTLAEANWFPQARAPSQTGWRPARLASCRPRTRGNLRPAHRHARGRWGCQATAWVYLMLITSAAANALLLPLCPRLVDSNRADAPGAPCTDGSRVTRCLLPPFDAVPWLGVCSPRRACARSGRVPAQGAALHHPSPGGRQGPPLRPSTWWRVRPSRSSTVLTSQCNLLVRLRRPTCWRFLWWTAGPPCP